MDSPRRTGYDLSMAQKKSSQKNSTKNNSNYPVQVDIVSDVVCPWCWLGYRLFDKARKQYNRPVHVTWRPYMLDPTVPSDGMDYKAYMKEKFGEGPSNKFKAMRAMLEEKGPSQGIDFQFENITRRPNTLNAHRLLKWAQNNADTGIETSEKIFEAFFTNGEDIGDTAVLSRIAGDVGLDAALTEDLLKGDQDVKDVQEEIMFFRGLGISGVPTFIYNGKFAVQGAQDPSVHLDALKKAAEAGIET